MSLYLHGSFSLLVNHTQVYIVLLDAKIRGFGFNVFISKLEPIICVLAVQNIFIN